jgi:CubicO group peptidase (beta-lactamase class C family)
LVNTACRAPALGDAERHFMEFRMMITRRQDRPSVSSDGAAERLVVQNDEHPNTLRSMAARITRRALYKPALALVATGAVPAASAEITTAEVPSDIEGRLRAVAPKLEDYLTSGMAAFDVPGAAVGIVAGDRLIYAKGFGERRKNGGEPVGPRTVFQIGSTTKAIGAALMAIAVDRGKLKWDDRVVDLYPSFALKDPWVTREFRVYDLMAQRSGLPAYANDPLFVLGFDPTG